MLKMEMPSTNEDLRRVILQVKVLIQNIKNITFY